MQDTTTVRAPAFFPDTAEIDQPISETNPEPTPQQQFHAAHIEEYRQLVEYLGTRTEVSVMLGWSASYLSNVLSDNQPDSLIHPGDLYGLRYLAQRKFEASFAPETGSAADHVAYVRNELAAILKRMEVL